MSRKWRHKLFRSPYIPQVDTSILTDRCKRIKVERIKLHIPHGLWTLKGSHAIGPFAEVKKLQCWVLRGWQEEVRVLLVKCDGVCRSFVHFVDIQLLLTTELLKIPDCYATVGRGCREDVLECKKIGKLVQFLKFFGFLSSLPDSNVTKRLHWNCMTSCGAACCVSQKRNRN